MLRGIRLTITALAIAALAFSGLVLCPCEVAAVEPDHDCCSPVTSWQAAGDCCTASPAVPRAPIAPAADAPALGASSTALHVPLARPIAPLSDVVSVASLLRPPRTILRI
jgi:hypothetical protein